MIQSKNKYNYILLWQGRFVSLLGDSIYSLVLGFIILEKTNSTITLTSIMSISMIFKILASLVSGSFSDRFKKQNILVISDLLRGILMIILTLLIYTSNDHIVYYFVIGILLDICAAFFNPTVQAIIPQIVSKDKLIVANARLDLARFIAEISGNILGGVLYGYIKPMFLVLFNGISYIFSAVSETFIHYPIMKSSTRKNIYSDIKMGYVYIWNNLGLRIFLFFCSTMNLFFSFATVLLLPYFQYNSTLGSDKYGLAMASYTSGIIIGTSLLSIKKIHLKDRYRDYLIYSFLYAIFMSLVPLIDIWSIIFILFLLAGFFMSLTQSIIISSMQLSISDEFTGRVFAAYSMILNLLKPIGYTLAGFLSITISPKKLITLAYIINFIIILLFLQNNKLKKFITETSYENSIVK